MLNVDRTTYVLTLFMACWLGVAVVMGWWLTCTVTVAALGRISWVAHRAWQAERRAAEARAQEGFEIVALMMVLAERNSERLLTLLQRWRKRLTSPDGSPE